MQIVDLKQVRFILCDIKTNVNYYFSSLPEKDFDKFLEILKLNFQLMKIEESEVKKSV